MYHNSEYPKTNRQHVGSRKDSCFRLISNNQHEAVTRQIISSVGFIRTEDVLSTAQFESVHFHRLIFPHIFQLAYTKRSSWRLKFFLKNSPVHFQEGEGTAGATFDARKENALLIAPVMVNVNSQVHQNNAQPICIKQIHKSSEPAAP